jgi:sugar lactone lactonase YvrE
MSAPGDASSARPPVTGPAQTRDATTTAGAADASASDGRRDTATASSADGAAVAAPSVPLGRPASCDKLPPLPGRYRPKKGPRAAEDFVFDRDGFMISVDEGNVYKSPHVGMPLLVAARVFSGDTTGTRMLANGDLVVADDGRGTVFRLTIGGAPRPLVSGLTHPNGMEVGLDGFVYVSDEARDQVLRIDPETGKALGFGKRPENSRNPADGLYEPNGLSFSPDYRTLYVAGFGEGTLHAIDMKPDSTPAAVRLVASDIGDKGKGALDGVAVDECGNVYVTEYGPGRIWRVTPATGTVELAIDLGKESGWIPNMHWGSGRGGWDPKILYVTDRNGRTIYEVELGVGGKVPAHLRN